jgi:predicted HTH transcriptional regulator
LSNIPGYIEQIGSGIRFMLDETRRMDLPAPQFREMSEFIVAFQKAPALRAPEPRDQYRERTLWEEHEDTLPEVIVQDPRAEQVEKRLVQALLYVQEHGFITNGIYRQLTRCHGQNGSQGFGKAGGTGEVERHRPARSTPLSAGIAAPH